MLMLYEELYQTSHELYHNLAAQEKNTQEDPSHTTYPTVRNELPHTSQHMTNCLIPHTAHRAVHSKWLLDMACDILTLFPLG